MTFPTATVRMTPALDGWRDSELNDLFDTLACDTLPHGILRGKLFAITGLGLLPRPLASLLYRLLQLPINPWRGKSFDQARGCNRWLWTNGPGWGHFRISRQDHPGIGSIWLDYNLGDNPNWLRGVRGEMRQLHSQQWLCRMRWQGRDHMSTLLWFTLTAPDHSDGAV